ncbi:Protein of unknown function [Lutibacter oricola]|uniref:DUF2853 domain-containing protein n=1 Tax=Lutibacter oricola TaxID=762486 RepID=A0A1H2ZGI9_9FLAO|nr:DUF2853 family protein [Lutibacter oricola]SDX16603.1 Protein of unknown function [Lutibacter oricola]
MSKFDEKLAQYKAEMDKLGLSFDADLLTAVTKGLGPSIYKADAETVSGSDQKELDTVKNNFLIKKLGLENGPKLDEAIAAVIEKVGKSNRNKYRAIVYYLLVKELGQESKY